MNATEVQTGYPPVHREATTIKTMTGGALMESLGSLATLALAIAGLAGAYSPTLAAIGTIVLGAAIWIEGGGFIAGHRLAMHADSPTAAWGKGLAAEFVGGLGGIVLGILALLGVVPMTLLSIAMLVFGASFLFSNRFGFASGAQSMAGLVGLVLGLLAVCGISSLTLVLVALASWSSVSLLHGASASLQLAVESHE